MAGQSWFPAIQGLAAFLTGNGQTTQRRNALKVAGMPVFDDGTQTVLGGVQVITGTGSWDTKSGTILVKGSGARGITLPDPVAALAYEGLAILVVDAANNSGANTITVGSGAETIGGSASATITTNGASRRLHWLSTGNWSALS
jgi:hypothetical protein